MILVVNRCQLLFVVEVLRCHPVIGGRGWLRGWHLGLRVLEAGVLHARALYASVALTALPGYFVVELGILRRLDLIHSSRLAAALGSAVTHGCALHLWVGRWRLKELRPQLTRRLLLLLLHQLHNLLGYLGCLRAVRRRLLDKILRLRLIWYLQLLILVVEDEGVSQAIALFHDALRQLVGRLRARWNKLQLVEFRAYGNISKLLTPMMIENGARLVV